MSQPQGPVSQQSSVKHYEEELPDYEETSAHSSDDEVASLVESMSVDDESDNGQASFSFTRRSHSSQCNSRQPAFQFAAPELAASIVADAKVMDIDQKSEFPQEPVPPVDASPDGEAIIFFEPGKLMQELQINPRLVLTSQQPVFTLEEIRLAKDHLKTQARRRSLAPAAREKRRVWLAKCALQEQRFLNALADLRERQKLYLALEQPGMQMTALERQERRTIAAMRDLEPPKRRRISRANSEEVEYEMRPRQLGRRNGQLSAPNSGSDELRRKTGRSQRAPE